MVVNAHAQKISESARRRWQDPEYRERQRSGLSGSNNSVTGTVWVHALNGNGAHLRVREENIDASEWKRGRLTFRGKDGRFRGKDIED